MDPRANKAKMWEGKCEVCDKSFKFSNGFECAEQPGRHTCAAKTYYHLGAGHIQNMRERRMFAPTLNLKADIEVRDKVTGQIAKTEGVMVSFRDSGIYETTDPQEQYYLDQHPGVMTGDEGKDAWEKMYLTPVQQLDKAQSRLADVQRQVREGNALLDLTRQAKERKPDAVGVR
jgi:hypothetical protein